MNYEFKLIIEIDDELIISDKKYEPDSVYKYVKSICGKHTLKDVSEGKRLIYITSPEDKKGFSSVGIAINTLYDSDIRKYIKTFEWHNSDGEVEYVLDEIAQFDKKYEERKAAANPSFSVIIPAHNEEKYIRKCLMGIKNAANRVPESKVQIIVVANRCTDKTVLYAKKYGAKVIENNDKCISSIRNAGVKAATGDIIVTIDADSIMTKDSLAEIKQLLLSGRYVGGGTNPVFDRMSIGIAVSSLYVAANIIPVMIKNKAPLSGGMFWCYKKDFDSIGGFDESLVSLEDLDFAARLSALGKKRGQKYGTLKKSYIITSARKFDQFGDWYLIKNRKLTKRIFTGRDRQAADEFYYDVR